MAGANAPYRYMPCFFSDLFEFGYEGVVYYLKDGTVRGAMMCNLWDKAPAARDVIQKAETASPKTLHDAIA